MSGRPPVIAVEGMSKRFGGALALDDVALDVRPGEVHGLLGENGSGKSTLIKVLAGFHVPEPGGRLRMHGRDVGLPVPPNRFRELGMTFVHQDLGLIPDLTVVENLLLGPLSTQRRMRIPWRAERARAAEAFERFDVTLDPDATVNSLDQTDRALLAIVRAFEDLRGHNEREEGGLLVLDEPTAFLPAEGTDRLFGLVRDVADRGAGILFVSHDLGEVARLTDRVTVLRDGRVQGTVVTKDTDESQFVELIVGKRIERGVSAPSDRSGGRVHARVENLRGGTVQDFSLELHEGELVGVTGLIGSGFEELPYLLFGARRCEAGTLAIDQRVHELSALTPPAAIDLGLVLLPANRQRDAGVGTLSVADNITLPTLGRYRGRFGLKTREMRQETEDLLRRFDVRPPDPDASLNALSGGNQQKALLAKWFQNRPQLLLLHEPTQGVDIGARQQIFELLRQTKAEGTAGICASSDHEQLAQVCDRVFVLAEGRIGAELYGSDIDEDVITERVLNSTSLATLGGEG